MGRDKPRGSNCEAILRLYDGQRDALYVKVSFMI